MQDTVIEQEIEAFLSSELKINPHDVLFTRHVDLFEAGYVDSVGFAELLAFLKERFGLEVPEDDLLSDEFSTIDGMAAIVRRLSRSQGEPAGEPSAS